MTQNRINMGRTVDYNSFAKVASRATQNSKTKESKFQMSKDGEKVYFSKRRSLVGKLLFKVVCSIAARFGQDLKARYGDNSNEDRQKKAVDVFKSFLGPDGQSANNEGFFKGKFDSNSLKTSSLDGNTKALFNREMLKKVMEGDNLCRDFIENWEKELKVPDEETRNQERIRDEGIYKAANDLAPKDLKKFIKGVLDSIVEKNEGLVTEDFLIKALADEQQKMGELWNCADIGEFGLKIITDMNYGVTQFSSIIGSIKDLDFEDGEGTAEMEGVAQVKEDFCAGGIEVGGALKQVTNLEIHGQIQDIYAHMLNNTLQEEWEIPEDDKKSPGDVIKMAHDIVRKSEGTNNEGGIEFLNLLISLENLNESYVPN